MITASVSGVSQVQRLAEKVAKSMLAKAGDALDQAADMILDKADEWVPVKTGRLKASRGKRRLGWGNKLRVEAGYFGIPYAVYVHENVDAKHAFPTQARFLSRAVFDTRGRRAALVRRIMGTGLRG